ncbi:MAG TPA: DUF1801 domain-containing protein [Candidatus Limnocylindrales bacterium]|nr:DUF1801 domain-containing protein [Candidatus Limnocylindrales bacterium]
MRAAVRERKVSTGRTATEQRAQGEADVRAAIDALPEPDRSMALRIHEIVANVAPNLVPRTFYGMPAYARDGKVVCFFSAKVKGGTGYASFGIQAGLRLDHGNMWPVSYAIAELTDAEERQLAELVRQAAR